MVKQSMILVQVPDPFEERTYVSRWKECAALVNEGFGAALASTYAHVHYDPQVPPQVSIDILLTKIKIKFM